MPPYTEEQLRELLSETERQITLFLNNSSRSGQIRAVSVGSVERYLDTLSRAMLASVGSLPIQLIDDLRDRLVRFFNLQFAGPESDPNASAEQRAVIQHEQALAQAVWRGLSQPVQQFFTTQADRFVTLEADLHNRNAAYQPPAAPRRQPDRAARRGKRPNPYA